MIPKEVKKKQSNFEFNAQIFLFRLYLIAYKQFAQLPAIKISLQNFKPLFPVILQILDLECHVQVSLKLLLSSFATSSWNLENWKNFENSIAIKRIIFSLHKSFAILWGKNFQNVILSFWLMSSDWNLLNCSIEFKWTWFSKAAVQQSFTK